jgi:hypothetical protein
MRHAGWRRDAVSGLKMSADMISITEPRDSSLDSSHPEENEQPAGSDRGSLRNELISLYHDYRDNVEVAADLKVKYEMLLRNVQSLLDTEFPGWHSDDDNA